MSTGTLSDTNLVFRVETRPGDSPDVDWTEKYMVYLAVPVTDLGYIDWEAMPEEDQDHVTDYAKTLASGYTAAASNMLMSLFDRVRCGADVYAKILNALNSEEPRLSEEYTDEDAFITRIKVGLEPVS